MEEQTTDTILNSLAEGVFTVDKNFKINFFNAAAEKVTGLDRKDVIGKFCKQVLKSELCYLNCPIASILENGKSIFEVAVPITTGKYGFETVTGEFAIYLKKVQHQHLQRSENHEKV